MTLENIKPWKLDNNILKGRISLYFSHNQRKNLKEDFTMNCPLYQTLYQATVNNKRGSRRSFV
ncbi:hypothetical protein E2C01_053258 [Portunus trituberculatus]|uniref:Uncharacterized protein n=1 Tax=Portunus trituberculatus TaxID=210409 RepID=A0A5B7GJT8_PORTR|nr:hypothetical protein [Portunus trituberculatus]